MDTYICDKCGHLCKVETTITRVTPKCPFLETTTPKFRLARRTSIQYIEDIRK